MKKTILKTFETWQDAISYSMNNGYKLNFPEMEKQLIKNSVYKENGYLIMVDPHHILGNTTKNI